MLASRVTTVPTSSETTIVRVATGVPELGRSRSSAANSDASPRARRMPIPRPISDAPKPISVPSRMTERSTCRREAPSVRRVASSRVRCAIVIESVLKMTNAPTKRAIPPKASRK
jgi:hypothetical protein